MVEVTNHHLLLLPLEYRKAPILDYYYLFVITLSKVVETSQYLFYVDDFKLFLKDDSIEDCIELQNDINM